MVKYFEKPFAFLLRDLIHELSYKLSFLMDIFEVFFTTITFFFLSKLVGNTGSSYLEPYGGNYFSFLLIGIAFFNYLKVSMESLAKSIREGQMFGTLEALLVTQTTIPTIIISSSLYSFIFASFKVIMYLLLGVFFFDIKIDNANVMGALLILFLTIISFSSIGILSASFIMVLKKGDPISKLFARASGFLCGVYYPVSILPGWLQKLSYLLPITYSLEGMRLALIQGYSFQKLIPNILALTIFSVIMLPLSVFVFSYAVKRAKVDGTLTQY